jgi:hypothetical protein
MSKICPNFKVAQGCLSRSPVPCGQDDIDQEAALPLELALPDASTRRVGPRCRPPRGRGSRWRCEPACHPDGRFPLLGRDHLEGAGEVLPSRRVDGGRGLAEERVGHLLHPTRGQPSPDQVNLRLRVAAKYNREFLSRPPAWRPRPGGVLPALKSKSGKVFGSMCRPGSQSRAWRPPSTSARRRRVP